METVLVTGGTGFIGLHCIQQLLDQGYKVRTTIRSESRKEEVLSAMKEHSTNYENLEIYLANLMDDKGWSEAISGCKYVLHVASPFFLGEPEDENVFIKPAVEGTLRVLNACAEEGVEKVVLTSSFAAVGYGHPSDKEFYSEDDWSSTDGDISHYAKSKTLAEKAAWNFIENLDDSKKFRLTVINPVGVTGPMLTDDIGSSNDFLLKLISGSMPACPKIHMGIVDVRDVAAAHILAMQNPASNGERFALAEKDLWYKDVAKVLKSNGFDKAPTFAVPVWLAKILANFSKELKLTLPYLGRVRSVKNTSKAKDILGWKPRPAEESIVEIAQQIEDMGLIK